MITENVRHVNVHAKPSRTPSVDDFYIMRTLADPCALVHVESITQALLLMHKQTVYLHSHYNNIFLLEHNLVYLHICPN